MPISVTCQCGARLEIDEKFLGKEIPCPDCQRPLPTQAPAKPPPLELPNYRRTSGLAVVSLALALVLMLIPLAPLIAVLIGVLALKQIAKNPNKLDGGGFARAGIILGGVFTFVGLTSMLSPYNFHLDQLIREFRMAGKVDYKGGEFFESEGLIDNIKIKRLSDRWSRWTVMTESSDVLFLVNTHDDAYMTCINAFDVNADNPEDRLKKVLEYVYKSELVRVIGELRGGTPLGREGIVSEKDSKVLANKTHEVVVDIRLGRVDRRLLIQFPTEKKEFKFVVGACRAGDFDRLAPEFRTAFESVWNPPAPRP